VALLLSAQNLEKSFGPHLLFRGLKFGIESGDRIGLIGPNGAGKSTLLKIIAGLIEPDGGEVVKNRGLRVGYLEQMPSFAPGLTIFDAVAEGAGGDPERLSHVHEWLARLELLEDGRDESTLLTELSGGWKKRVALARALAREPDLLVLDEPTNHLDLESILWLERFLEAAPFATLTVTHDRMFLQRVANRILDLDRRHADGLYNFRGGYADFIEAKDALMAAQEKREEIVGNTLRRETEWLRRGAKARTTKQQARIERAGVLQDEAEDLRVRNQSRVAQIDFQSMERHPQKLIEAKGLAKSFGGKPLFEPVDLLITPKTRLGLLGSNGTGKTTLIRLLLGDEEPSEGKVVRAERLQVAYFAQHRDELDPKKSVLKTICPEGDYVNDRGQYVFGRSYLNRFLFRPEQLDMPVEKLSGGEKSRLRLAQLMLTTANVLVLDEPTNDLDLATLNVLEESLKSFEGAVILVTHDRYFLEQIANEILAFTTDDKGARRLERFADTLQYEAWLESSAKQKSPATAKKNEPVAAAEAPAPGTAAKKRLSYKEKRELEGMEANILATEARVRELEAESQKPENIANGARLTEISKELAELTERIENLYARWAELEA